MEKKNILRQSLTPELAHSFGLKETKGALVADIVPGGPADNAGLKRGDIIISFDSKKIKDMTELPRIVADTPIGKTVDIGIIRNGREKVLKITISYLP